MCGVKKYKAIGATSETRTSRPRLLIPSRSMGQPGINRTVIISFYIRMGVVVQYGPATHLKKKISQ
jgi:hypothetical protein